MKCLFSAARWVRSKFKPFTRQVVPETNGLMCAVPNDLVGWRPADGNEANNVTLVGNVGFDAGELAISYSWASSSTEVQRCLPGIRCWKVPGRPITLGYCESIRAVFVGIQLSGAR